MVDITNLPHYVTHCGSPVPVAPSCCHPDRRSWRSWHSLRARGVEPGCETSVPSSNGRLVANLTDLDSTFEQTVPRGLEVRDDEIDVAKRTAGCIGESVADLDRAAGAHRRELHGAERAGPPSTRLRARSRPD